MCDCGLWNYCCYSVDCNCCDCWCNNGRVPSCGCQTANSCTYNLDYGTFLLSGGATPAYSPGRALANSYDIDLVSRQYSV